MLKGSGRLASLVRAVALIGANGAVAGPRKLDNLDRSYCSSSSKQYNSSTFLGSAVGMYYSVWVAIAVGWTTGAWVAYC